MLQYGITNSASVAPVQWLSRHVPGSPQRWRCGLQLMRLQQRDETNKIPLGQNSLQQNSFFLVLLKDKISQKSTTTNKTSNLSIAHETRDSLSSSGSHIVLVYLQPFRRSSPLKCAPQPKLAKTLKRPIFGVQGHSRSPMLIKIKSSSPVLVMISSMFMPICNCFYVRRATTGK